MKEAISGATLARQAAWVGAAGLWLFFVTGLASYDAADWPSHVVAVHNEPVRNLCGRFGAIVAYWGYHVLGPGVWVFAAGLAAGLCLALMQRAITQPMVRGVGLALMALAASGFHALLIPDLGSQVGANAGLLATTFVEELLPRFNVVGTLLILTAAFGVGAIVVADRLVLAAPAMLLRTIRGGATAGAHALGAMRRVGPAVAIAIPGIGRGGAEKQGLIDEDEDEDYDLYGDDDDEDEEEEDYDEDEEEDEEDDEEDDEYDDDDEEDEDEDEDEDEYEEDDDDEEYEYEYEEDEDEDDNEADEEEDEDLEDLASQGSAPARRPLTAEEMRAKIAKLPVSISSRSQVVARDEDIPRQVFANYEFPTLELLKDPETNFSEEMERLVRDQAQALEQSLQTYGIDGEVVGIESGPAVTLYSVQLAPGTKVSKVSAVASDVARSLRAQNIRIVPNMVGRTAIGIEVPNLKREKVRLKELMSGGHSEGMVLPMFLGKDASGEPLVADLTRMPHMLIAGTTGSGKSVCMNSILVSWLYTKRPDELKLVLVDPKMVELSQFQDIPHLMCPVVTEAPRATAIMEWAVERMEERYELLREARVQNIAAYNALSDEDLYEAFNAQTEEEQARVPKKLPYMVFVVDELADMMMTCKEVEHSIVRIAQKARAVGIHLILATQRPQANVVTGLIKANMPCRISFKVASGMDSRIVLDSKGAELLLGQGDMMFLTPHTSSLRRAQGTLLEDGEIRKVVRFLKNVAQPSFERSLISLRAASTDDGAAFDATERDPLFDKAVEIMIESGRGSVSLLQRRLAIGYSRASRLVDQMGLAGILGDHKGSVAREVLVSPDEWEQMKSMRDEAEAEGTLFEEGSETTEPVA